MVNEVKENKGGKIKKITKNERRVSKESKGK